MRRSFFILLTVLLMAPASALAAPSGSSTDKVEVFVTGWCSYCRKLESFLKKKNIEYTRYDVENDAAGAEIFQRIGGTGVPVTRIDGQVIDGYDPDAILAALDA